MDRHLPKEFQKTKLEEIEASEFIDGLNTLDQYKAELKEYDDRFESTGIELNPTESEAYMWLQGAIAELENQLNK